MGQINPNKFLVFNSDKVLETLEDLIEVAKKAPEQYKLPVLNLIKQQYELSLSSIEKALEVELLIRKKVEIIKEELLSDDNQSKKPKILFLASNPSNLAQLQLHKEFFKVFVEVQEVEFALRVEWAVNTDDLQTAILKHKPRIIHFSGHGSGNGENDLSDTRDLDFEEDFSDGGIYLQDANGESKFVEAKALTNLFQIFSKKMEIDAVILNACHSAPQAKAISEFVPYVIGMNKAVTDKSAIEFSTGFYRGISSEDDIEFAFELANNKIMLEGYDEADTPVLYKKEG